MPRGKLPIGLAAIVACAFTTDAEAQSCRLGEETWLQACEVSCTSSWEGGNCPQTCTAQPLPGYALLDARVVALSENNGSSQMSRVASGFLDATVKMLDVAFEEVASRARVRNDEGLSRRIAEDREATLREARAFASAGQAVQLVVFAARHGSFLDRKRGWSHARLELLSRCIVPSDLRDQLLRKYGL